VIGLENLSLSVPGTVLCEHLTATIRSGEKIGIFGPNGAGKSTFLKALLGEVKPSGGWVQIEGAEPAAHASDIAYLPQYFETLPVDYSVAGFLSIVLRGERWGLPRLVSQNRARIDAALARVSALPLKNKKLKTLSGGERQRVLFAALFLETPKIVLLDEPLANLDPRFSQELIVMLMQLHREMHFTLLITAHDFNPLLAHLDRVMFIGRGQAVLDVPEAVIQGSVLSALYGTPLQVIELNGRKWVLSSDNDVFLEGQHCHAGGACVPV
jgi:zinc/manganese transport system ATP-binding protein